MSRTATIAVALLALAFGSLCARPDDQVIDRPIFEDGYYALAVARHLALGHGVSVDGLHPTNGVQPLFTFLCAIPAWLSGGDRIGTVRGALALSVLVLFAAAGLFGALVRRELGGGAQTTLVAAAVYLAAMFVVWQHLNGLETGLLLLMVLTCVWTFGAVDLTRWRGRVALGAVLGLLVLTRIDTAILVMLLAVALAFRLPRRDGLGTAAAVAVISAAVSSPWWVYNQLVFGSLMPTSGKAQQAFALEGARAWEALHAVAINGFPWLYLFGGAAGWKIALYLTGLGVLGWAFRQSQPPRPHRLLLFLKVFALFCVFLMGWYPLSSWATHFYRRYFACASLFPLAMGACVLARGPLSGRLRASALAVLPLPALALAAAIDFAPGHLPSSPNLVQLELVKAHVPPSDLVAAYQSGTLSFFRDGVVNLDGKVNPEALKAKSVPFEYLERLGVNWLCDWESLLERNLRVSPAARGWTKVAEAQGFALYRRGGD